MRSLPLLGTYVCLVGSLGRQQARRTFVKLNALIADHQGYSFEIQDLDG
jgi:hypothetical protein